MSGTRKQFICPLCGEPMTKEASEMTNERVRICLDCWKKANPPVHERKNLSRRKVY